MQQDLWRDIRKSCRWRNRWMWIVGALCYKMMTSATLGDTLWQHMLMQSIDAFLSVANSSA
jgi:hypothetical protein